MNDTETIYSSVNMYDITARYGLKLNRRNAACCPFHREKTASFKIYKDGKKYHCFGCGADGDVISFVMQYFNINFRQAMSRIGSDFNLPLRGMRKPTVPERRKMAAERAKRLQEDKQYTEQLNALWGEYERVCDEYINMDIQRKKYMPVRTLDDVSPMYREAVYKLPYLRYKCDMLQIMLEELQKERRGKNVKYRSA